MKLTNVLMVPVWTLSIFSTAKSFEKNPVLGNRLLNRMGLHVARGVLAHLMTRWRLLLLSWMVPAAERRKFRRDGYLAIPDVLPATTFAALRREALSFDGDMRRMCQGDTYTYLGLIDAQARAAMPAAAVTLGNRRLVRLMMYTGAAARYPLFFVHCIKNGVAGVSADPQKDLHTDTFHPTMKAWLFLDDVDETNGPFNYVPGSHRLSWRRLRWEYAKSIAGRDLENRYARRGSLRISEAELTERGFGTPLPLKVPANTLVIADTFGFHRRGAARPGSSRLALYAYSRGNPFSPVPGLLPSLRRRIEERAMRYIRQKDDRESQRRGVPTTWQQVSTSELRDHAEAHVD